ncbi:Beta-lactamase enzyme family protein [Chitinophaga niabensis]|uniref:Beta-lactamase enzyme family protein n=2 Tax=Chitinophaga niabensis TaxID=536979 RepID=A0A1N6FU59_9BACT|nr:Beta-lactamase enzyme family protein [Chitinophaga niabensis]
MMQRILTAGAILVFFTNCQTSRTINSAAMHNLTSAYLDTLLQARSARLGPVMNNPEEYRLQIIYTQINRKAGNQPVFTDYYYHVSPDRYFYPASTVKMPAAFLALEKLNRLKVDKYTPMYTDSLAGITTAVTEDTSSENTQPSVAHYIKKIFLVSDNDAFNRLYEFIGQEEFNRALWEKGYPSSQIRHRLDIALPQEANRHTNAIWFEKDGKVLYRQKDQVSTLSFAPRQDSVGKAHYKGSTLVNAPFDFSLKNRLLLADLHNILKSVIFPESVTSTQAFRLTEDDYRFLYRYMSQLPTETRHPAYDTAEFHHNYVKYLMGGANGNVALPAGLRIFNKPGWAYGFLTDVAYFVDFDHGVEFLLSATIYANKDGVIGDDKYDFETTGKPFLKALGEIIYEEELKRTKKYKPDLKRYKINYNGI